MNWVDAAIIISLAVAGFWGLSAGLIRIILPLLTLIIGLVLASRLDNQAGSLFSPLTDSEGGQRLLGFIAVFLLVFLSGGLVSTLVKAGMRFMFFLSPIDHPTGRRGRRNPGIAAGRRHTYRPGPLPGHWHRR